MTRSKLKRFASLVTEYDHPVIKYSIKVAKKSRKLAEKGDNVIRRHEKCEPKLEQKGLTFLHWYAPKKKLQ